MAKYDVASIFDQAGNEFSLRDGVHKVSTLPAVADGTKGVVYLLSSDNKFYMLSDAGDEWISISYPADSKLDASSTNAIQNKVVTAALNDLQGDIDDHIADKGNPHEVTADQVGAYTTGEIDTMLADYDLTEEALEREGALSDRIDALESSTHTHENKALLDTYDQTNTDLADAVSKKHTHSDTQVAAMDSGITSTKVASYDSHISNTTVHITAAERTKWNGKQDKLTNTDAEIQSAVSQAHTHDNLDELKKIERGDKAKWDAKQDALEFLTVTDVDTIWDSVTV